MYDLLIKHVRIIDGTSAPWFRGWVAVKDGRIVLELAGAQRANMTPEDLLKAFHVESDRMLFSAE